MPCEMSGKNIEPNLYSTEQNHLPALNKPNEEIHLFFVGPITEKSPEIIYLTFKGPL